MDDLLTFDGAQSFRYRIALSCLSGRPVRIEDIRLRDAVRPGLRYYEASLLQLVEALSDGMDLKTAKGFTQVTLYPGILVGTEDLVFDCHAERGLAYYLEFLTMIGPFCKQGLNVTLRGITEHPEDLSVEALRACISSLAKMMELPGVSLTINKRGCLPKGGGEVVFTCEPLKVLKPFQSTYAGRVKRVRGTAWTCHMAPAFAQRSINAARRVLNELLPDVWVYSDLCTGSKAGGSHGFGICLVAETMKQCLYSSDGMVDKANQAPSNSSNALQQQKSKQISLAQKPIKDILADDESGDESSREEDEESTRFRPQGPESLGERVACELLAEIALGGITDRAFQWLPIFYMALADEFAPSRIMIGSQLTPASIELLRHLRSFFNVKFAIEYYHEAVAKVKTLKEEAEREEGGEEDKVSQASTEDDEAIQNKIKEGEDQSDKEESDVAIVEDGKDIEKMRVHQSIILTCVGVGLINMARKTF